MPWRVEKRNNEFCVIKESDNKVVGCHDTRPEANAQLAALNASESKETANYVNVNGSHMTGTITTSDTVSHEKFGFQMSFPFAGVKSFSELEELRDADEKRDEVNQTTNDFNMITNNIMSDDDISVDKKVEMIESATNEMAVRIRESEEKQLPFTDRVFNAIKSVFVSTNTPESIDKSKEDDVVAKDENDNMMIWKDHSGTYRWIAQYSNKFRDNDNPPEIISSESHAKFEKMVDNDIVSPPQLWLWHEKDWCLGQAEWVGYDHDSGFAWAGGVFFPEANDIAEILKGLDDVRVSHGMPRWSISRDTQDPTIITEHITQEISPLPGFAAANKLTGFIIHDDKEIKNMAFAKEKKLQLLEQMGVTSNLINQMESRSAKDADLAEDLGIESKEQDQVEDVTTDSDVEDTQVESKEESHEQDQKDLELKQALETVVGAVTVLSQQVNSLKETVAELQKSDSEKVADKARNTPLSSMIELMNTSIIGKEATRVDGRTTLAKSGPVENRDQESVPVVTGIGMVDGWLNGSKSGFVAGGK